MSRILITGGLGFLGSSLVEEFANRGLEIRILGRLGHRRPDSNSRVSIFFSIDSRRIGKRRRLRMRMRVGSLFMGVSRRGFCTR